MKIYHLIPVDEVPQHTASSICPCHPVREKKGDDFWQGIFLGREVYQHNELRTSQPPTGPNSIAAVADENWKD